MTNANARAAANLVLITAGIAAAYVILTTPPLRRFARRALFAWLGASLPAYFATEMKRAWVESGQAGVSAARIGHRGLETA